MLSFFTKFGLFTLLTAASTIVAITGLVTYLLLTDEIQTVNTINFSSDGTNVEQYTDPNENLKELLKIAIPFSIFVAGTGWIVIYLQTGGYRNNVKMSNISPSIEDYGHIKEYCKKLIDSRTAEIFKIQHEIDEIHKKVSLNLESIDPDEKKEIVDQLKLELLEKSNDEAFKEYFDSIESRIEKFKKHENLDEIFLRMLGRLDSEISTLGRRGNLNLALGIITTLLGLIVLGYFVLEIDSIPEDKVAFLAYFLPKLSLVVLIEIFAFFFLKLYKESLSEIKYFQNEITNIESKFSALKLAMCNDNQDTTTSVVSTLLNTERNAVLKKGQTTAEIEKAKIEQQNISTISEKVSKIIGTK
ncbi:MAG: hypothetical protein MRK00_14010 [Nitrosomonas sp.]|nr:hypothetical protein [Nitrosomonas sp.]